MSPHAINTVGLILDICGAILIFIGSERLSSILTDITLKVAENFGRFDSKIEEDFLTNKLGRSIYATVMSRMGLTLLVLGFIGQLIATWSA